MTTFEIVKKPIEENTYLNTYNAKLSTGDHCKFLLNT